MFFCFFSAFHYSSSHEKSQTVSQNDNKEKSDLTLYDSNFSVFFEHRIQPVSSEFGGSCLAFVLIYL